MNHIIIINQRGEWSYQEDVFLLDFFLKYGGKWAKMSKIFTNRTEHAIKNRFFSLLAYFSSIPIRIIKTQKLYLNKTLVQEALEYNRGFLGRRIQFQEPENNMNSENVSTQIQSSESETIEDFDSSKQVAPIGYYIIPCQTDFYVDYYLQ